MNQQDQPARVVIVGAGFGGLSAARELAGSGLRVTVIDKRNYHLFQPLLYQVATAALSPAEIAVPIRGALTAGKDEMLDVVMEEVTGVDRQEKFVTTREGKRIDFDYLILAPGARYTYFGHDDWRANAPSLKSLDDALVIRHRLLMALELAETSDSAEERRKLLTFVVVGGGPTGVEMAGAVAELARVSLERDFSRSQPQEVRVILVEVGKGLLGGYSQHLQAYARKALEAKGVEVRLETAVEAISEDEVSLGGEPVASANTIWCAGVEAQPAAQWLGIAGEKNGTVQVQPDLTIAGSPDILVVGDASSCLGPEGKPYPALAPAAKQQGRYAARAILRRVRGQAAQGPFRYRDWGSMATIGRNAAVGSFGRLELKGYPAWLIWGAVHIGYLIGFRSRLIVGMEWLWAWVTYGKGARLIIHPPENASLSGGGPEAGKERPKD